MLPLPCPCMTRTSCFMLRITPRTFVSNIGAYVSAVWSVIGPTWPSVPALFTATSRRPNCATVWSTRARTSSSLRTSGVDELGLRTRTAELLSEHLAGFSMPAGSHRRHAGDPVKCCAASASWPTGSVSVLRRCAGCWTGSRLPGPPTSAPARSGGSSARIGRRHDDSGIFLGVITRSGIRGGGSGGCRGFSAC